MFRGPPPMDRDRERERDMDWRDRRGDFGPPRGGLPPRLMHGPPPPMLPAKAPEPEIDREKTCPLLMRVFPKQGGHHRLEDYAKADALPSEIQIYTWMDANLRELSDLIKDVQPAARNRMARLSFAFVYPDRKGRNVMRQVGTVHSTRPSEDDNRTLRSLNFQIGDYLDVAIYT